MADKPTSRTEANKPRETSHLTEEQKRALDDQAEVEHTHGQTRERLAQGAQKAADD